jgi:hypothetical protein
MTWNVLFPLRVIRTPSLFAAFVFSFASLSRASHELAAVIPSFPRIRLRSHSR